MTGQARYSEKLSIHMRLSTGGRSVRDVFRNDEKTPIIHVVESNKRYEIVENRFVCGKEEIDALASSRQEIYDFLEKHSQGKADGPEAEAPAGAAADRG